MKNLDTGKDKIQKICNLLKNETIEPAKQQAREIIENAHMQAEEIINNAKKLAEDIEGKSEKVIQQKNKVFESSLKLASKQVIEDLKQKIEKSLFDDNLAKFVAETTSKDSVSSKLINVIVEAIEKEGINVDLHAYVSSNMNLDEINKLLVKSALDKLRNKISVDSNICGGVLMKLEKENIIIDVSDEAIKELIANFIREDFRDKIFGIK
jgi:V/A-type H+/Na+-transporting ATPase subunit E